MENIHVKLYAIQTGASEVDVVKIYFVSGALTVLLFRRAEPFVQFW